MLFRKILLFIFFLISIPSILSAQEADLRVAQWNIGHFSLGKASKTTIGYDQADSMAVAYRSLVDSIHADIFGVCEYNPLFSVGKYDASLVVFGSFKYDCAGKQYNYNCNAQFSKFPLTEPEQIRFSHSPRYAFTSTFYIDSIAVTFVETHLEWNNSQTRAEEMKVLLDTLQDKQYVILCGDFNNKTNDEFYQFMDAGYSSAFFKDARKDPKYNIKWLVVDNILVKGFDIVAKSQIIDRTKSDHPLVYCDLKIIRDSQQK